MQALSQLLLPRLINREKHVWQAMVREGVRNRLTGYHVGGPYNHRVQCHAAFTVMPVELGLVRPSGFHMKNTSRGGCEVVLGVKVNAEPRQMGLGIGKVHAHGNWLKDSRAITRQDIPQGVRTRDDANGGQRACRVRQDPRGVVV